MLLVALFLNFLLVFQMPVRYECNPKGSVKLRLCFLPVPLDCTEEVFPHWNSAMLYKCDLCSAGIQIPNAGGAQ